MSGDSRASQSRNPFFCAARMPFTFQDKIFMRKRIAETEERRKCLCSKVPYPALPTCFYGFPLLTYLPMLNRTFSLFLILLFLTAPHAASAQEHYIRYQEPDFLTFGELKELSEDPHPGG